MRWLSEYASVIALANLRSLARAPEVKMVLITQVILFVIFGSMLATGSDVAVPEAFRPLLAMGAIVLTMISVLQLLQNQFSFDRNGFRVFILTAAPRREILLGKNISLAPIALGTGAIALAVLQFVYTLRVTHFLASLIQLVSVFIIFCMVGNMTSIFAPMAMSTGSLKPANPRLLAVLIQMLITVLSPIAVIPAFIPLGIELLLDHMGWGSIIPIYLIVSLLALGILLWIYRHVLSWQGQLLQQREQRILDVVTTRIE